MATILESMVQETVTKEHVLFSNELFAIGRVLSLTLNGKSYGLVLKPAKDTYRGGLALELLIGNYPLLLEFSPSSDLTIFDERLKKLNWKVYPEEIQEILINAVFETPIRELERALDLSIGIMNINPPPLGPLSTEDQSYDFCFQLFDGNPHQDSKAPCVLSGYIHTNARLAGFVLRAVQERPRAIVRTYPQALPRVHNMLDNMLLPAQDLACMSPGDVILLNNGRMLEEGRRRLIGLAPYELVCRQEEGKLSLEKVVPSSTTF